jgi:hypothetical protein
MLNWQKHVRLTCHFWPSLPSRYHQQMFDNAMLALADQRRAGEDDR